LGREVELAGEIEHETRHLAGPAAKKRAIHCGHQRTLRGATEE
jgi:hypothetical protein